MADRIDVDVASGNVVKASGTLTNRRALGSTNKRLDFQGVATTEKWHSNRAHPSATPR